MKKAIVLLLALAVIGGAAFAEDAAYTLSGSASLTWGYDLDTEAHGFTNATSATLTVPFVGTQSATHAEDAISGSITITDFGYTVSTGGDTKAAGSVTAKILLPSNLYLAIASAPTFSVDNATLFTVWYDPDGVGAAASLVKPSIPSAGGFSLGMTGDFNFALCVGSTNKHTSAATAAGTAASALYIATGTEVAATGVTYTTLGGVAQALPLTAGAVYVKVTAGAAAATLADSDYMVGANVGYTVTDLLTVSAKAIFGAFSATTPTVAAGVKVTVAPKDSGLSAVVAADADLTADANIDAMATVDYTMADLLSFGAGGYVALMAATPDDIRLDARVRASLLAVENLTAKVGVDVKDLLNDAHDPMWVQVGFNLGYKYMLDDANYVSPYFNGGLAMAGATENAFIVDAGVTAMLFPKTTFNLDFNGGAFAANAVTGAVGFGEGAAQDSGLFTFTTTITF